MSIDFPRAWEIARSVDPAYHHNKCSFNVTQGGVLCDCDVVNKHPEAEDETNFYGAGGEVVRRKDQQP